MSQQRMMDNRGKSYDSMQDDVEDKHDSFGSGRPVKSMTWRDDRSTWRQDPQVLSFIQTRRMGTDFGLSGYKSWLNVLLIFVPLGIVSGMLHWNDGVVFTSNFLAIIPLAMILGRATEDIAQYTNQTIGGLLNATFGNAVELIMSINALRGGLIEIVKATLVGSILSNLLLVLGMSFLCGGVHFIEQTVSPIVAEANAGLLIFSSFGFIIPTIFAWNQSPAERKTHSDEKVSLVIAVLMLLAYCGYLFFQLFTHTSLYNESVRAEEEEEDEEEHTTFTTAMVILIVSVLFVAVNSDFLVDSVEGFANRLGLGSLFVSLMLLPLVGNAAEHLSAVTVAVKDKMDLSIGIACGSSVQIAAFVAPLMVVVSWIFGLPHLTLDFHTLETVCIVMAIFIVNTMLRDFTTNWLEGALLIGAYLMVGGAVWYKK